MTKDELFLNEAPSWGGFQFDESVTKVFDDMLNRSIPHYAELQKMIVELVHTYYQDQTSIYDLGCSLGTLLGKIQVTHGNRIAKLVGVDNSTPMITKARNMLDQAIPGNQIALVDSDISEAQIENASLVIMNYTLQFIRPPRRERVLVQILDGLNPGGVLILSEKVIEDDGNMSKNFQDIYYRFKMRNGYSATEIARKRECLEHVLVPYSLSEYTQLLSQVGFKSIAVFHKWFNFASLLAIKEE